jgi:hypothetical protein
MQAGRSRTYVANAGQMMLVMELRDAVTGTLLARAADRKAASDSGSLRWSSSVFNRAEAESILEGWGKRLKQALDAARTP